MVHEPGRVADGVGVSVGTPFGETARSHTHWLIARYDEDATSWASTRLGGEPAGRSGFLQPSIYDFRRLGVSPYDMSEVLGNLVTNAGWKRICDLAIGTAVTAFASATCRIGAGVGTGAVAGNDTDLSGGAGATGRFFQPVSGAGTATQGTGTSGTGSATLALAATFGTGDGNFAWGEFGVDQGTATGTTVVAPLLNHKVSAQGTKASGQTWTATVTFSFSSS